MRQVPTGGLTTIMYPHVIPYKERSIDPDKPVEVYLNLNKKYGDGQHMYSIRQSGKVVGHAPYVHLLEVEFVVKEKGRDRVRKEKRKNVHAWVKGYADPLSVPAFPYTNPVRYNPFRDDQFMVACACDGKHGDCPEPWAPVDEYPWAFMGMDGKVYV